MLTAKVCTAETLFSLLITSCNRICATNCHVSCPCTHILSLWKISVVLKT